MLSLRPLLLAALPLLVLPGCNGKTTVAPETSQGALSARDDLGRTVTLTAPARRVIALAPNAVEILCAVGAAEELAGVPEGTDYPVEAKKLPEVGSFSNPDEEAIVAQKPDLAVVSFGNPQPIIDRLKSRGVPVFVLHPKKVGEILASMRSLGRLTGHEEEGERTAAAFQARLDSVHSRVRSRPPVRAALLVWDDPITVAGGGAYLHDALELAGGENVASDLEQPYPTLDPEQFAVRNPAVILFAGHDASRAQGAGRRPGIRATEAAKTGRIHAVDEDLVLRSGPRLIDGIEAMARALHPDRPGTAGNDR